VQYCSQSALQRVRVQCIVRLTPAAHQVRHHPWEEQQGSFKMESFLHANLGTKDPWRPQAARGGTPNQVTG
jgi:hypothetical protein